MKRKTVVFLCVIPLLAIATLLTLNVATGFFEQSNSKEFVVLIHGQGRSRTSFLVLQKRLDNAGYATLNFPYNSSAENLDTITDQLHSFIRQKVTTSHYHLVGHSLGNVIIRHGFKSSYRNGLKRIVMLAPPNHPSQLAQQWRDHKWYKMLFSDAGQKLASPEFYRRLPVPTVEFAVIAGNKAHTPFLDEPSDGVVTVENTKLSSMNDFAIVPCTHTFIMNHTKAYSLILSFLEHGAF